LSLMGAAAAALSCNVEEVLSPAPVARDPSGEPQAGPPLAGTQIPADPQRSGDPKAGYDALVTNGYVSCGVPWSAYSKVFKPAPEKLRLPGRTGKNAELPYYYTAFTTKSGIEVVSANCLTCHAGMIQGKLVVGLGNADQDFTVDPSAQAKLSGLLVSDPAEKVEWSKWKDRVVAIGPYTTPSTVGVNPA